MLRNSSGKLWTITPMHNGAAARDREESDGAELNRQIACRVNAGL
jgi:hypothetical protein